MAEICFDIKMISKESIFDYARRMALFLRFRRLGPWSSDLPGAVASVRNLSRKVGWVVGVGPTQRPVTIAAEKQTKLGFPTAAGDRRRLSVTAETRRRRSCGGGSDPGPLSSSWRSEETAGLCFSLYHIVDSRASDSITMSRNTSTPT